VEQAKEVVDPNVLSESMDKINNTMRMMNSNLNFSVDEETGIDVVKVVDMDTEEVIRQFPSKEVLAIARALDQLQGLLVRDKA
jgi:flagellar protein FlaG